jgi:hypothetical protein
VVESQEHGLWLKVRSMAYGVRALLCYQVLWSSQGRQHHGVCMQHVQVSK